MHWIFAKALKLNDYFSKFSRRVETRNLVSKFSIPKTSREFSPRNFRSPGRDENFRLEKFDTRDESIILVSKFSIPGSRNFVSFRRFLSYNTNLTPFQMPCVIIECKTTSKTCSNALNLYQSLEIEWLFLKIFETSRDEKSRLEIFDTQDESRILDSKFSIPGSRREISSRKIRYPRREFSSRHEISRLASTRLGRLRQNTNKHHAHDWLAGNTLLFNRPQQMYAWAYMKFLLLIFTPNEPKVGVGWNEISWWFTKRTIHWETIPFHVHHSSEKNDTIVKEKNHKKK